MNRPPPLRELILRSGAGITLPDGIAWPPVLDPLRSIMRFILTPFAHMLSISGEPALYPREADGRSDPDANPNDIPGTWIHWVWIRSRRYGQHGFVFFSYDQLVTLLAKGIVDAVASALASDWREDISPNIVDAQDEWYTEPWRRPEFVNYFKRMVRIYYQGEHEFLQGCEVIDNFRYGDGHGDLPQRQARVLSGAGMPYGVQQHVLGYLSGTSRNERGGYNARPQERRVFWHFFTKTDKHVLVLGPGDPPIWEVFVGMLHKLEVEKPDFPFLNNSPTRHTD